jgi:starvation-inducible DNA-binding protein
MAEGLELQTLKTFATVYAFAQKALNFHWNVEGSRFVELHALFEKASDKAWDELDCFAESIRSMNVYVPANFTDLKALSAIQDTQNNPPAGEMLSILLNDCRIALSWLKSTYKSIETANNEALCNILSDIIRKFTKIEYWLVSASK